MKGAVAITGTHGTGKSTEVLDLCRDLNILHPGKRIVPLIERASLSPLPINKESTEKSQMYLFVSHIAEELYLTSRFDAVVSDRSAVDMIAYTRYFGFYDLSNDMLALVRHHMPIYHQIHFKFSVKNEFWFPNGLRESEDRQFRQDIEDILLGLYRDLGLEFTLSQNCLPGNGMSGTRH